MKSNKAIFSTLVILVILLSTLALPTVALAGGGCESAGTSGDDTIVCDTDTTGDVKSFAGDDEITVESGVTVTGNVKGGNGEDAITNNGVVAGNIAGGLGDDEIANSGVAGTINGNSDNDSITNSGTADAIWGGDGDDEVTNSSIVTGGLGGGLGDDEITNSGTAESISGGAGNDTITNSGTVVSVNGGAGDDSITNNGIVTNDVKANAGNDTVILETGVQVGGTIMGANTDKAARRETDTLVFNMSTYNQAEYYAAQTVIAGATDELETYEFSWDGGVISWQYFDTLTDKLALLFKSKSEPKSKPEPVITATLIFVEEGFLKIYQNDASSTLRFYGLGKNNQTFITELAAQSWENAEIDDVLLDFESIELGTHLVVTMLENGQLQVEYFSLVDGTLLFSGTIMP